MKMKKQSNFIKVNCKLNNSNFYYKVEYAFWFALHNNALIYVKIMCHINVHFPILYEKL